MSVRIFGSALLLAALLMAPGSVCAQPKELPLTVATVVGKVELFKKGDAKWGTADLRDELNEGDGLRTGPSVRATLRSGGGNSIRLSALTQVFLLPPEYPALVPQPARLRMDRGWLWVAVTPGGHASAPIDVSAGPARVFVRDGGVGFRLNRDGSVLVRTYHGSAVMRGSSPTAAWERSVPADQEVLVPASGPPEANRKITLEEGEGPWVLWNQEQDYVLYGGKAPKR